MTRKITGCCTCCGEELLEVLTRWPEGHPYAGEPRRLGAWHDNAARVQFLLSGGSTMDVTFCEKCADEADGKLPEIWRLCLASLAYEIDNDVAIGMAPTDATHRFNRRAFHVKLANEIPFGVLSRRKWRDQEDARET